MLEISEKVQKWKKSKATNVNSHSKLTFSHEIPVVLKHASEKKNLKWVKLQGNHQICP